jgi:hypothetical protein
VTGKPRDIDADDIDYEVIPGEVRDSERVLKSVLSKEDSEFAKIWNKFCFQKGGTPPGDVGSFVLEFIDQNVTDAVRLKQSYFKFIIVLYDLGKLSSGEVSECLDYLQMQSKNKKKSLIK